MAPHFRFAPVLACVTALAATSGCADPEGEFNNFITRYEAINPDTTSSSSSGGDCTLPMPGDADGDYFLALSPALSPKTPLVFLATVTTSDDNGALAVNMSLQPLSASDRMTAVDTPVVYDFVVGMDGDFTTPPGEISFSGEANPVSDSPIAATGVVLSGSFCAPTQFVCGTVAGELTMPLASPLAKSTFTMTAVTSPSDYPEPPPINCKGDPAGPPKAAK